MVIFKRVIYGWAFMAAFSLVCSFAQEKAQPPSFKVAKVTADAAGLFTMEADTPDMTLPWSLKKGAFVKVWGEGESCKGSGVHFLKISVPGGLEGFVFAKLLEEKGDGFGEISRSGVVVRMTPSTDRYPAFRLSKGSKVRLLEKKGQWWRVLSPEETTCWMREKDLDVLASQPTDSKGIDTFRMARLTQWEAMCAKLKEEKRLEELKAHVGKDMQKSAVILVKLNTLDIKDVDLAGLEKAWKEFQSKWPGEKIKEAGMVETVGKLEKRIDVLKAQKDAWAFLQENKGKAVKPVPASISKKKSDPNEGWIIGHLKYLPDAPEGRDYAIVKGEKILCIIKPGNERYNLRDFMNCFLRVKGKIEGKRKDLVLAMERMEILDCPWEL